MRQGWTSEPVDLISTIQEEISECTKTIKTERSRLETEAKQEGGVNLSCGFVTFEDAVGAQMAVLLSGNVSEDSEEWSLMVPPSPEDVLWNDLTQDQTANAGRTVLGFMLVSGLAFAYLPLVIGITNVSKMVDLCEGVLVPLCPLNSLWQGMAPTLGLVLMVGFLPTFLILIFQACFTLRAAQWGQAKLQVWYFWFQMLFVILATAIGQDFVGFVNTLASEPFSIFMKLADTMPFATHFYMNFLVLQWVAHTMNLTRYVMLMKFKAFSQLYDEETARGMSEPEDQDYYGQGSRAARWSIMMVIGIVFGTLSPPINLLTFVNFGICRVVYGYLYVFAETKKTDLGGVFWVRQLEHLFWGNIVYGILMTGVLYDRSYHSAQTSFGKDGSAGVAIAADSIVAAFPAFIAFPTVLFSYRSLQRFRAGFSWEKLPMTKLMEDDTKVVKRDNDMQYRQPELLPGDDEDERR